MKKRHRKGYRGILGTFCPRLLTKQDKEERERRVKRFLNKNKKVNVNKLQISTERSVHAISIALVGQTKDTKQLPTEQEISNNRR